MIGTIGRLIIKVKDFTVTIFTTIFRVNDTHEKIRTTDTLIALYTSTVPTTNSVLVYCFSSLSIASRAITPYFLSQLTARVTKQQNSNQFNDDNLRDAILIGSLLMLGSIFENITYQLLKNRSIMISEEMGRAISIAQLSENFESYINSNPGIRIQRTMALQDSVTSYVIGWYTTKQTLVQLFISSIFIGTEFDKLPKFLVITLGGFLVPCVFGACATNAVLATNGSYKNIEKEMGQLQQILQESYLPHQYETITLSQMGREHAINVINPHLTGVSKTFKDYHWASFKLHGVRDSLLLIAAITGTSVSAYAASSSKLNFSAQNFQLVLQILVLLLPYLRGLDEHIRTCLSAIAKMEENGYYPLLLPSMETPQQQHEIYEGIDDEQCLLRLSNLRCHTVSITDDPVLEIREKETVALVGQSGGGKTTIARLMMGLYKPATGAIQVSQEILRHSKIDLSRIAVVPQETALFSHLSLHDNVCYGIEQTISNNTVKDILTKLGLKTQWEQAEGISSSNLPGAAKKGQMMAFYRALSKGQKQRISLARAIVKATIPGALPVKLFILDEPTSALDAQNEAEFIKYFNKICKKLGVSILIITHRLPTIRNVNKVYCIENGGIVAAGDHAELSSVQGQNYYKRLLQNSTLSFFGYREEKENKNHSQNDTIPSHSGIVIEEAENNTGFSIID